MDKDQQLKLIKDEIINLKKSPLYGYRVQNKYYPVIGEGNHSANIMFIGEAPGENEAKTARPFCGRAGKILDELLASISLPRDEVYITNIVKDRPPGNRDPSPDEIALYAPFLMRQIEIIQPKVIATLGRFSMSFIFQEFGLASVLESISKMHGRIFDAETGYGGVKLIPLYHPAVAIYNQSSKSELVEDFNVLKQFI